MCTLTIRRRADNILVTMNRDEKRDRPGERPPHHWVDSKIFAPQDTKAYGTWMGANERGEIACLLNGYRMEDAKQAVKSRGEIIPFILSQDNPHDAVQSLAPGSYASFHLVVVMAGQTSLHSWDGQEFVSQVLPEKEWYFFTSSSWRQDEVKAKRQDEFENWRQEGAAFNDKIPAIHIQHEQGASWYSVLMAREDACTKSITQFEVGGSGRIARYWPNPQDDLSDFEEFPLFKGDFLSV